MYLVRAKRAASLGEKTRFLSFWKHGTRDMKCNGSFGRFSLLYFFHFCPFIVLFARSFFSPFSPFRLHGYCAVSTTAIVARMIKKRLTQVLKRMFSETTERSAYVRCAAFTRKLDV